MWTCIVLAVIRKLLVTSSLAICWQQQQNMLANFTLDSVAAGRQWSISAYKYVMRLSISYPVAENLLPGMD